MAEIVDLSGERPFVEVLLVGGSHDGDWITTKGQGSIVLTAIQTAHAYEGLTQDPRMPEHTREVYELVRLAPRLHVYVLRGLTVADALGRLVRAYVPVAELSDNRS